MQTPRLLGVYGTPIAVGVVFAACSFGVYPLMDMFGPNDTGAIFVYFCFGVIGAAAALVAISAVLWPGKFWPRLLLSFSVGLLLFGFWLTGCAVSLAGSRSSYVDDEWRQCVIVLLCLPLVFLAIQSPLWLVRLAFHWDLALLSSAAETPDLRPLTIRDMLATMGLIGFGLAGARFAMPFAPQSGSSSEAEFWIWTGIALASCTGISLASTLPIVVATLRAPKPAFAMLGIGIYAAIVLAITFAVIGLIEGSAPGPFYMMGLSTSLVTFIAAMATPLLMVRRRGFRLRWGRKSVGTPAQD